MKYLILLMLLFNLQDEWVLKNQEDGISVYGLKDVAAGDCAFKVVAEIDAPIEVLDNLIQQADKYHCWQANLDSSRIIKTVEKHIFWYYLYTDVPWPVSDRDMIVSIERYANDSGTVIRFETHAVVSDFPIKNHVIRLNRGNGYWVLKKISENRTQVMTEWQGELGSEVPVWLTNLFLFDGPYESLCNLRELAEKLSM